MCFEERSTCRISGYLATYFVIFQHGQEGPELSSFSITIKLNKIDECIFANHSCKAIPIKHSAGFCGICHKSIFHTIFGVRWRCYSIRLSSHVGGFPEDHLQLPLPTHSYSQVAMCNWPDQMRDLGSRTENRSFLASIGTQWSYNCSDQYHHCNFRSFCSFGWCPGLLVGTMVYI